MVEQGHRAVIFYCVQRNDAKEVQPAIEIDPNYARTLAEVMNQGVEAIGFGASVSTDGIVLEKPLPVICPR